VSVGQQREQPQAGIVMVVTGAGARWKAAGYKVSAVVDDVGHGLPLSRCEPRCYRQSCHRVHHGAGPRNHRSLSATTGADDVDHWIGIDLLVSVVSAVTMASSISTPRRRVLEPDVAEQKLPLSRPHLYRRAMVSASTRRRRRRPTDDLVGIGSASQTASEIGPEHLIGRR
jgi:hypothetical protein